MLEDSVGFGCFRLSRREYRLSRRSDDGSWVEVPLRPKAFDLLRYMVENPGRLISPDEFLEHVWPRIHVQSEALKGHVLHVRTALDDDPAKPAYIETVRGRGYRFIADIDDAERPADARREANSVGALVGRSVARRQLDTLFLRALSGEAGIGFVTGEAGIGKTALMGEFVASAQRRGALAVISCCLPGSAETDAYYPVLDILTQLARSSGREEFVALLARMAPTWLIQLPWLMPPTLEGGTRQDVFGATPHRMIRELCDLLEELARDRLVLLVIEDVHWADRATLDLINAMAARRLQTQLLLLTTMRTAAPNAGARAAHTLCQRLSLYRMAKEIALTPLTEHDVADHLASFGGTPPARLTRYLHERSEGNPLFMTAVLEHLAQQGHIRHDPGGWVVVNGEEDWIYAPPNLARLIEAEIDRLEPTAQLVLEAASISEGTFAAAINQAASPVSEPQFEAICEELARSSALIERAQLVTLPNGLAAQTFAFRHMIFREVVYDRQSATHRAAGHLEIARRLEAVWHGQTDAIASLLAAHHMVAGHWCSAIGYLRLAARNAQMRFSHREAATILERALGFTVNQPVEKRVETEVELLEDLARIYAGSLDARAGETYSRLATAAAAVGRLDVECRALLGFAFTLAWTDVEHSMQVFSEAIEKSAALDDPIARARVRTFAHGWRSWAAGWSEADAAACEASLEEIRRDGDPLTLNASLVDYSLIVFTSSRYWEAHDLIESCFGVLVASRVEQRADISLPLWILRIGRPWCLLYAGEFGRALDLFKSGVRSFLDNGDVGRAATLQFYEALCHVHLHDFEGALNLCAQASSFCDEQGSVRLSPNERQIGMVVQGLTQLGLGRIEAALELFESARQLMDKRRTLSAWHWRMALEWGTADAFLALGRLDEAREHARAFHDLAYSIRERTWRALASEICARVELRRGRLAEVAEHLRAAWSETAQGELLLVSWRLEAVQAALCEREADPAGAAGARAAAAALRMRLCATLPEDHVGRSTLMNAAPILG